MPESEVDLAKLFNTVTEVLNGEKEALNQADSYNHDHGDHMVENFKAITAALEQKRGAPPAEQLAFASEKLNQNLNSGSAKIYAQGLAQAAGQLQGQDAITSENAVSLVQALLGGGGNELQSLYESKGSNLGNLLTTGTALMQAKEKGGSPLEALLKALMAGSQMNQSSHHSQSGQTVGGTLLSALGAMLGVSKPKPKPEPKPKPVSKPKPRTKPKAKPKPKAEPKPKPKPRPASKPKPRAKPKTKPKPKSKPRPKARPKSRSEPIS
jgi:hypothetical protein